MRIYGTVPQNENTDNVINSIVLFKVNISIRNNRLAKLVNQLGINVDPFDFNDINDEMVYSEIHQMYSKI